VAGKRRTCGCHAGNYNYDDDDEEEEEEEERMIKRRWKKRSVDGWTDTWRWAHSWMACTNR
jgi:hypothetical protein